MDKLNLQKSFIDPVDSHLFRNKKIAVDVLRLDVVHPVISGNKWFKLKEYLSDAKRGNKKTVVTFGGAFSNHIIATAAAAQYHGLNSIGIIRGEQGKSLSHTLHYAAQFGMELFFSSRKDYKEKKLPEALQTNNSEEDLYIINEGGYGLRGAEGAKSILEECNNDDYTHICAAVGTGTTIAGLVEETKPHQQVIGITALKKNFSIEAEIAALLSTDKAPFSILYDYHFGGYAKHTAELIEFMNNWYRQTGIPSDFVYTGKLFYAINDLIQKDYFSVGSKLLIIHSGGLQGNKSLPKGTLIF